MSSGHLRIAVVNSTLLATEISYVRIIMNQGDQPNWRPKKATQLILTTTLAAKLNADTRTQSVLNE